MELCEHLVPQNLLMSDSVPFGILEEGRMCVVGRGKKISGWHLLIPSICFIKLGRVTTQPF